MQLPPRVPLLWKLCNFTRFARLVWGRSKCSPSFLIQVYPLLDRKPNAEATVAASAVITIPTCHISWVLSHLSHVTYVWHMSHVTYGPSHIRSTHSKGTRGGGCICVWFSILWRVQLNKEAGRALRHCDLAYTWLIHLTRLCGLYKCGLYFAYTCDFAYTCCLHLAYTCDLAYTHMVATSAVNTPQQDLIKEYTPPNRNPNSGRQTNECMSLGFYLDGLIPICLSTSSKHIFILFSSFPDKIWILNPQLDLIKGIRTVHWIFRTFTRNTGKPTQHPQLDLI